MDWKKEILLNDLKKRTLKMKEQLQELLELPDATLQLRPETDKWNAIECIEHLNLYSDFYLPEIEQRMARGPKGGPIFKSSWLGNYFAKAVAPVDASIDKTKPNPMKTFKNMNPSVVSVRKEPLEVFKKHLDGTLELLDAAQEIDLTKTKTSITISKLIKLRLGDTFRVLIYHNQRHMEQACNAVGKKYIMK